MLDPTFLTPPATDEFELTLFGPGYGEAIACHVGDGLWVLVDSCLNPETGRPATLDYLRALGVDPSTDVRLVVVSHFDQDHCRGIAAVAAACPAATVVTSAAILTDEFRNYAIDPTTGGRDGYPDTREIIRLTDHVLSSDRSFRYASSRLPLWEMLAGERSIGQPLRVTALSPSDHDVQSTMIAIGRLALRAGETARQRASRSMRNQLTVALWIDVGPVQMLLGGDLETTKDKREGWSAVLADAKFLRGKASLFKVPHHGSKNAHHKDVWGDMLQPQPVAIVCPWMLAGKRLPQPADVQRIVSHTPRAYLTADPMKVVKQIYPPHVERELATREARRQLTRGSFPMGAVRSRASKNIGGDFAWSVQIIAGSGRQLP